MTSSNVEEYMFLFKEGTIVEVTSNEEGFIESWYIATILKSPNESAPSSPSKVNKFLIQYHGLNQDNNDSDAQSPKLLEEYVYGSSLRPLPPIEKTESFQLNDIVDAFHNDGWWTGTVTKVLDNGYSVTFKIPPHSLEFKASDLRVHLKWVDQKWVRPEKQVISPSFEGETSHQRRKGGRSKIDRANMELMVISPPNEGGATSEQMRKRGRPKKLSIETPKANEHIKVKRGRKTESSIIRESQLSNPIEVGTGNSDQNKLLRITWHDNGESNNKTSLRQKTPTKKRHEGMRWGEKKRRLASKVYTKRQKAFAAGIGDDGEKVDDLSKAVELEVTDVDDSGISPSPKSNEPKDIQIDEVKKYSNSLPFVKSSPIWEMVESMEVYKKTPQKPHFKPLSECREQFREGFAIGHMVTFSNVVEKSKSLKLDDPLSSFDSCLIALLELEMHGFDVKEVQDYLNKLSSIKEMEEKLRDEAKVIDSLITKRISVKTSLEEKLNEMDKKMKKLKDKRVSIMSTKDDLDSKICTLKYNANCIVDEMKKARLEFETLVASPL